MELTRAKALKVHLAVDDYCIVYVLHAQLRLNHTLLKVEHLHYIFLQLISIFHDYVFIMKKFSVQFLYSFFTQA
jgi:hypothetical protein